MVFLNFLNFFFIFLEFSIACRVGTERSNNFCFLSFWAVLNLFFLQIKPQWYSSNFLNFFAICLEFSITHWVGTKRSETIICIFPLSRPFLTNFILKRSPIVFFFNFLNFFAIFYEFSITRRVETKRNDNFYFPSFSAFFNLFWL